MYNTAPWYAGSHKKYIEHLPFCYQHQQWFADKLPVSLESKLHIRIEVEIKFSDIYTFIIIITRTM